MKNVRSFTCSLCTRLKCEMVGMWIRLCVRCASIAARASMQRVDVSRVHFRITKNYKHLKLLNCKNHMVSETGNVVGVVVAFSIGAVSKTKLRAM